MNVSRARVVVTHWVHPELSRYLAEFCDAVMPSREQGVWPRQMVSELAADADGLMACMADTVDEEFLAGCPRLRVISATLKGHDSFGAEACTRHGVWLTIVPTTLIAPTAELAIGLMRRIPEGDEQVRRGDFAGWRPQLYGSTLRGATVGLAGMGQLGQAIARGLAGLGPVIVYYDGRRLDAGTEQALALSYLSLEHVAESSDVMVAALPLTPQTRHLIDARLIQRMRPGAFLVKVGRGSVVDKEAVASALESGCLGGYAADVFEYPRSWRQSIMASTRAALASTFGQNPSARSATLEAAALSSREVAPSHVWPVRPRPARNITPLLTAPTCCATADVIAR